DTYQPLFMQVSKPSGARVIWHPSVPSLMYYLSGSVFGTWNPQTGAKTTIHTFSGYTGCTLSGKSYLTNDGDMIAIQATRTSDSKAVGFAYKISTDHKYRDVEGIGGSYPTQATVRLTRSGLYLNFGYGGTARDSSNFF